MSQPPRQLTEQENFWKGRFGDEYCDRNQAEEHQAAAVAFFARALARAQGMGSAIEFGANVGLNLRALRTLFPGSALCGVEINERAAAELRHRLPDVDVRCQSFLGMKDHGAWDLSFVKGVLIHIAPEMLKDAYEVIYNSSKRYILVAEYYNTYPVEVEYRGHSGRLFKRDFAGEMLDAYGDLHLLDYGFFYRRDPLFPQDDLSYFLLEKR